MSVRRSHLLLPALLLTTACFEANTEEQSFVLRLSPLFYSEAEPLVSGTRALQGSRACYEMGRLDTEDGWLELSSVDLDLCYSITLDGTPIDDGDCIVLDELREYLVEYAPLDSCPFFHSLGDDLVPDRFRLQVVPPDGLRARLEWYLERLAIRWYDPGLARRVPEDVTRPSDEPLRLVPGVEVAFPINVVDAAGERVAWDLEQGRVRETRAGGATRELVPLDDYDTLFPVSIGPGEQSTLTLELPGVELPVVEVIATPAEAAASIQIVMANDAGSPRAARAMVRDAEGRVIYGTPVEWTVVEGYLAMGLLGDVTPLPIPEYTFVHDGCVPPPSAPQARRAVVRAQLGALTDELELEWIAHPEEEPSDDPFEPHPMCQRGSADDDALSDRGCGCTTSPTERSGAWLWLVALGAVVGRRRRPGR